MPILKSELRFFDLSGQPLYQGRVYIGQPKKDPTDTVNKLIITDDITGERCDNPFYTDADGYPINANGQSISPSIPVTRYSQLVLQYPSMAIIKSSPVLEVGGGDSGNSGGGNADFVLNDLDQALQSDLSTYNLVFIRSIDSAWEVTDEGPQQGFYAHRTGATGAPSTGGQQEFYDLLGNEFKKSNIFNLNNYHYTETGVTNVDYVSGIGTQALKWSWIKSFNFDGDLVSFDAICADPTSPLFNISDGNSSIPAPFEVLDSGVSSVAMGVVAIATPSATWFSTFSVNIVNASIVGTTEPSLPCSSVSLKWIKDFT